MHRNYAVLWSEREGTVGSGRLELSRGTVELSWRGGLVSVPLAEITAASIDRGADSRLRGLPVLSLRYGSDGVRIASLEGTGALYEIARLVESEAPALRASGM